MIKGILFDYGGTIDTNGHHWAHVLKDSYAQFEPSVSADLFAEAYVFGEKSLAIHPLVQPSHHFLDVLTLKITQQFKWLREKGCVLQDAHIASIAEQCNDFARQTIEKAKPVLQSLSEQYPIVMVSNFYGNLHAVLEHFGLLHYFQQVVESAVVGVRKPDPAIYQMGVEALALPANECVVIGDSFGKDIVPAKQCGCAAIWLNAKGWNEDKHSAEKDGCKADIEIRDFAEIPSALQQITG